MRSRQNVPGRSKMASKPWNRLAHRTVTTSCTVCKKTQKVCILLHRNAIIGLHIIMSQYSLALPQIPALIKSAFSLKMLYSSILCVIDFCCLNFHKSLQEKIREIVKFQQKGYIVAWISSHFRRWEEKMTRSNWMKFRLGVYNCKLSLIRPPIDKPSPLAPVIGLHRHVPWTKRGTAKLFTIQRNYTPSDPTKKGFWPDWWQIIVQLNIM